MSVQTKKGTTMIEKTYIMIKPDAVANRHVGEIVNRIERSGLTIERMVLEMVTPEQAEANYAEHKGPVVKMVISGENAVANMRRLMGATDCAKAEPGTIRGDFGLCVDRNVIHGSDSPASAEREIGIFFG